MLHSCQRLLLLHFFKLAIITLCWDKNQGYLIYSIIHKEKSSNPKQTLGFLYLPLISHLHWQEIGIFMPSENSHVKAELRWYSWCLYNCFYSAVLKVGWSIVCIIALMQWMSKTLLLQPRNIPHRRTLSICPLPRRWPNRLNFSLYFTMGKL